MLTFEEANELFEYREDTGHLIWKVDRHIPKAGDRAGCLHHSGYRVISIGQKNHKKQYLEHQLIWFMKTGEWSDRKFPIDHINGDKSDNRWSNLRRVSFRQNCTNRVRGYGASGVAGVRLRRTGYEAAFGHQSHGSYKYLGTFKTLEEAQAAVAVARSAHFTAVAA